MPAEEREKLGITDVIIAISDADSDKMQGLYNQYRDMGCRVQVLDTLVQDGDGQGSMGKNIREFSIEDLLFRFTNEALKDTCQRVGGDPTRKLSPEDRLVGASRLAVQQGVCPCFMAIGGGAAVYRYIKESDDATQSVERAKQVLETVSGLSAEDETAARMLHFYEMILNGADLSSLVREADKLKAKARTNVI